MRARVVVARPRFERFKAEVAHRVHAAAHPTHRIAAAFDAANQVEAIWCETCVRVFLDRIEAPRTIRGLIDKAKRARR